jgi:hypothetical protein
MSKKDSSSPAFPIPTRLTENWGGMTLRDYFAAKAMQGLLAQSNGSALLSTPKIGAGFAYQIADAMLAERDK